MSYKIEPNDSDCFAGDLQPMADSPRPELLAEMAWRREVYDFDFYTASIFASKETPTSSRIEVAYSRQLGGCFAVWFSGVSGLEAPEFCNYGWLDCPDLKADFGKALFRQSLLQGAPIIGYHLNIAAYYDAIQHCGQPS